MLSLATLHSPGYLKNVPQNKKNNVHSSHTHTQSRWLR